MAAVTKAKLVHADYDGIPVIDISPWTSDQDGADHDTKEAEKTRIAKEIFQAFSTIGFIVVVGHGIPGDDPVTGQGGLTERAFQVSQAFFELPKATKSQFAYLSPESNRGYIAMGQEKLDGAAADIKETFDIGYQGETAYPNRWPVGTPIEKEFKDTMLEYFTAYDRLHLIILQALARGMGFDNDDYFTPLCNANHQNLRLLHYPECDRAVIANGKQKRGGIHTDYGTITLVAQNGVSGLVAQKIDGTWVSVPPIAGGIAVNVGEMLQRWSNDILRATPHQILDDDPLSDDTNKPKSDRVPERYSIAFFCNANKDTSLECLPVCQSADRPPRYPPINAFAYITKRLTDTIPVMERPKE
jgi:isopenicillin N synthase-like dioxygenase